MNEIEYIERSTGDKKIEAVPGGGFLKFLYGQNPLGKLTLWVLVKRKLFSVLGGRYMNSKRSAKRIAPFIASYGIDINDYLVPKTGFKHFNDFFYRKIRPERRPIDAEVVSPADGKILAFNSIDESTEFFVKGTAFDLERFLGDKDLVQQYTGGAMAIIRLAPVDYHRYHFPVSGMVSKNVKIKGAYYSVSPFALQKQMRIFCENKREYVWVDSENHGRVLICDVGATLTGGIIQTHKANTQVEKGDEKGYFAFGGSTLILLFEKGKVTFNTDIVAHTNQGYETTVKMGEQIAS